MASVNEATLGALGLLVAVLAVVYSVRRLRRFRRSLQESISSLITTGMDNQFRQVEALVGIVVDLKLEHSLPPTRGWAASPDFLRQIGVYTLEARPRIVVECGSGVSTIVLARCMQLNNAGHVYSLEHLQQFADGTRRELQRHGLTNWATVINAPLQSYDLKGQTLAWYSLDGLPPLPAIDMLVVDGPPEETSALARYPAGPFLFGRLSAGGVVFLDDAHRRQEQVILKYWATEFPQFEQEIWNSELGYAVLRKTAASRS